MCDVPVVWRMGNFLVSSFWSVISRRKGYLSFDIIFSREIKCYKNENKQVTVRYSQNCKEKSYENVCESFFKVHFRGFKVFQKENILFL